MQSLLTSKELWSKHTTQLELLQHQSSVISRRLEQTTHHMQISKVEQLRNDVCVYHYINTSLVYVFTFLNFFFTAALTEKVKSCEQKRKEYQSIVSDLELKTRDTKGHQEKQRKDIENELMELKKKAEKSKQAWTQREDEYRTLTVEIEDLKETIKNTIEEVKTIQENITNLKSKREESAAELAKIQVTFYR